MKNISIILFFICTVSNAQQLNIIPKPSSVVMGEGFYVVKNITSKQFENAKNPFKNNFRIMYSWDESKDIGSIFYGKELNGDSEKYKIEINSNGIFITGAKKGMLHGINTMGLMNKQYNKKMPYCTIIDSPRFAYRGMHLDVARHFQPVSYIKKYLIQSFVGNPILYFTLLYYEEQFI